LPPLASIYRVSTDSLVRSLVEGVAGRQIRARFPQVAGNATSTHQMVCAVTCGHLYPPLPDSTAGSDESSLARQARRRARYGSCICTGLENRPHQREPKWICLKLRAKQDSRYCWKPGLAGTNTAASVGRKRRWSASQIWSERQCWRSPIGVTDFGLLPGQRAVGGRVTCVQGLDMEFRDRARDI
jgi:hypothetical protein